MKHRWKKIGNAEEMNRSRKRCNIHLIIVSEREIKKKKIGSDVIFREMILSERYQTTKSEAQQISSRRNKK
jgi:hypothetical protein